MTTLVPSPILIQRSMISSILHVNLQNENDQRHVSVLERTSMKTTSSCFFSSFYGVQVVGRHSEMNHHKGNDVKRESEIQQRLGDPVHTVEGFREGVN